MIITAKNLRNAKAALRRLARPKPNSDYSWTWEEHGFSQSSLKAWMACREEARLSLVRGLKSARAGSESTRFGTFFHGCLEHDPGRGKATARASKAVDSWISHWAKKNPRASASATEEQHHFGRMVYAMLCVYFKKWAKSEKGRVLIGREGNVRIPYQFDPSIPGTWLNGQLDAAFNVRDEHWLEESKTRGRIDPVYISEMLGEDFQVNLYLLIAAQVFGVPFSGVCYNVIRKPGLRQRKKETNKEFAERVADDVQKRPDHYFYRFEVAISQEDVARWEHETLQPLLREVWRWYDALDAEHPFRPHWKNTAACQRHYGKCDFFGLCHRNDEAGLVQKAKPFDHYDV